MIKDHRLPALLAGMVLLTGCASTSTDTSTTRSSLPAGDGMTSGMVMPDGSTMAAGSPASSTSTAGAPSAAETMICGPETRTTITTVLGLTTPPTPQSTWADHLYTCTYPLPMGTFIVSVKQSTDTATAKTYFTDLRTQLGTTETLDGLGQASYGTTAGKVVLIKDNDTLMVDATQLPATFGAQQSQRFDFAYEIASDILGCWTNG